MTQAPAAWPRNVLLVGCGNMGGAMLAGWLRGGMAPERLTVLDPHLPQAPAGVRLERDPRRLGDVPHDALLLGIKPQQLADLAPALAPLAAGGTVVLSMLAGVDLTRLGTLFPQARAAVRVMPNLAVAIGQAPIALVGSRLDPALRDGVTTLLAPLGTPEWLADEALFDAVTALAGSGPAFVYRFIDALAAGAVALGLAPDQAGRLALAMAQGAAGLATQSPDAPGVLADKVASPGGTTRAGLDVLDAGDALVRLVAATLAAAARRSAEMAATLA